MGGGWFVNVFLPSSACTGCLHPRVLPRGSRGVDGHSWGDPYLKRRLRFPRTFLISAYSWNYVGAVQTEPVSKPADGEEQQGYRGHRHQQPVRSTDRCMCTCTCVSVALRSPLVPSCPPHPLHCLPSRVPDRIMASNQSNGKSSE